MINDKYSYKSFKRQNLTLIDPLEFNNSEIIGSNFYQSNPFTVVFPSNLIGVTFIDCNLDNCVIPNGCTVQRGTNQQIMEQNDLEYWIVDTELKPVKPREIKEFEKCSLSIDPKDIPKTKLEHSITYINDPKKIEQYKITALMNDYERLKSLLKEKGEL